MVEGGTFGPGRFFVQRMRGTKHGAVVALNSSARTRPQWQFVGRDTMGRQELRLENRGEMFETRFYTDSAGRQIAYALHGAASAERPLLLCPAWWVSHLEDDWTQPAFRSFFEALAEGLCLVRYDRPGVGLSAEQAINTTLAQEAATFAGLAAAVAADLRVDSYHLFGFSCGGPVALEHATAYPDRVGRLCLYGSFADGATICERPVQQALLATVRAHWGLGSRALADIFVPDGGPGTRESFARLQRSAAGGETAAALLELSYRMNAVGRLAEVRTDTLVLHRRGDRAIPVDQGRALAAGMPRSRLVTLEGRVHPPWLGNDAVATLANTFLRGLELPSTVPSLAPTAGGASASRLDRQGRQLLLGDAAVALTPLEYGVLCALEDAGGAVVTRDTLLEQIWRQPFGSSNRVDVLMRGLRKKLGDQASAVETVVGHGFRFTGWHPES